MELPQSQPGYSLAAKDPSIGYKKTNQGSKFTRQQSGSAEGQVKRLHKQRQKCDADPRKADCDDAPAEESAPSHSGN